MTKKKEMDEVKETEGVKEEEQEAEEMATQRESEQRSQDARTPEEIASDKAFYEKKAREYALKPGTSLSTPETALTTQATEEPFDDGLEEVTAEDLPIPRIVIGQTSSPVPDEAKGKFYCDMTGEAKDSLNMVVMRFAKSRALFENKIDPDVKFSRDAKPICRSDDFDVPRKGVDSPMADVCKDCPYSKWKTNSRKEKVPPPCSEVWNLIILDYDSYVPAFFSMKSLALKPAKKMIGALKMLGTKNRIPAWGFKFHAALDVDVRDSGNSYIPVFSDFEELTGDVRESMNLIRAQMKEVKMQIEDFDESAESDEEAEARAKF